MGRFSINVKDLERRNLIEAHAKFDARAYIQLMKEKSPENLAINIMRYRTRF